VAATDAPGRGRMTTDAATTRARLARLRERRRRAHPRRSTHATAVPAPDARGERQGPGSWWTRGSDTEEQAFTSSTGYACGTSESARPPADRRSRATRGAAAGMAQPATHPSRPCRHGAHAARGRGGGPRPEGGGDMTRRGAARDSTGLPRSHAHHRARGSVPDARAEPPRQAQISPCQRSFFQHKAQTSPCQRSFSADSFSANSRTLSRRQLSSAVFSIAAPSRRAFNLRSRFQDLTASTIDFYAIVLRRVWTGNLPAIFRGRYPQFLFSWV